MEPVERVEAALRALGLPGAVRVFDGSTATADEAAAAVGCALGQIVKTLCFLADGRPTIALIAGDRQADTAAIAQIVGTGRKKLRMGTPEQVLAITGFAVGGVAPIGLTSPCDVLIDETLRRFDLVWAAAGAHNAVFSLATAELSAATGGQWAAIVRGAA